VEHLIKVLLYIQKVIRHRIMRETAIENMRQLLRLPINIFVYPIGAVSALQRSPRSSIGICISAFFITFFASVTMRWNGLLEEKGEEGEKRKREREREFCLINIHFSSYDSVEEDHSVIVARKYLDYLYMSTFW